MLDLYNNHENKNWKFKMDITGVDASDIKSRLIIESNDTIYMVKGQINGTECKFDVPVLENFKQGQNGKVYYEVIIQDEQYSKLWEENFNIVSKTEVKVLEGNFSEEEVEEKPKATVNVTSLQEEVKPEIVEEKVEEPKQKVKETSIKEQNDIETEIYMEEEVFSFDSFLKNKK